MVMKTRLLGVAAAMWVGAASAIGAASGAPDYYVFFDWGKNEISRDAATTLDGAVAKYRERGGSIQLTGYTDRSGPANANLLISGKRARLVRDYLIGKGVPASAVTADGRGEADPVIATADGVREIQNRRVEIKFTQ